MLSLALKILCNLLRLFFNKLIYGKRYSSEIIERISAKATISLFENGRIRLQRNIELAPYVDIKVLGNGNLTIGQNVYMNSFCMISCQGKISIGEGCMFGPGVKIFDNNHKFSRLYGVSSKLNVGDISIGNNCWIASDAIILKGAQIGNNCIIGAGCIINSNVPDNSIIRLQQTLKIEELR